MAAQFCGAEEWAQQQFGSAQLGDERRSRRLVQVGAALAQKPRGALTRSFFSYAELKAAYRLFACDAVTFEQIASPHWRKTRMECSAPGDYLMIEDTSILDFTEHADTEGLGHIGDGRGRGMLLHTTLAVRIEDWNAAQEPRVTVAGLLRQKCWSRESEPQGSREPRSARFHRKRESQRWAEVFEDGGPPPGVRWTFMADRESDIYEVFATCEAQGVDVLLRAKHKRKVDGGGTLFEAVAHAAPAGRFELPLRARPGVPARTACVELRAAAVTLNVPWRPERTLPPQTVHVVEAREIDPPANIEPIHWVLLTTWPVHSFEESLRVVKAYVRRWLVEEYHKALKTGAQIEETQLSTAERIQALLGVLSIVAVRLLSAKLLAETEPESPVDSADVGAEILAIMEAKIGKPKGGWTQLNVLKSIARFGGFLARKSDGMPGWLTLWRGWHDLQLMAQGFNAARGL